MGNFFCLKLHIAVDCRCYIFDFKFRPGNVDDRKVLEDLLSNFTGKVFENKGYILARLKELLSEKSINLSYEKKYETARFTTKIRCKIK